jgi:FkbM family methyltransferase
VNLSDDIREIQASQAKLNKYLDMLCHCANRTDPAVTCPGSQGEEDEILEELLPGDGAYIDIGAAEPIQCSNTWSLYQRGWRGLLVEPQPGYLPALSYHRKGDLIYNSAVYNRRGMASLRVQGTVSSLKPSWDIDEKHELAVPCCTTADLVEWFPEIVAKCRLCSIDVEGAEREVLESNNWGTFHPEVFVVEYRDYNPEKLGADCSGDWEDILLNNGYVRHAETQMNLIFRRT